MQSSSRAGDGAGKGLARSSGEAQASLQPQVWRVRCRSAKERRGGKKGRGGPVLRDHHLRYSLGKTLLSLHSEQWDLLPSSLCSAGPAMSPHRQPGLQQRNFHARLPSLCLMHPLQHAASLAQPATWRRSISPEAVCCHAPQRTAGQGRIPARGVSPGWRMPAGMESSRSRRSRYRWVAPKRLVRSPLSALLWASALPWAPAELSCNAFSRGQCQTHLPPPLRVASSRAPVFWENGFLPS